MAVGRVLPLSALGPVQLLRQVIPVEDIACVRVKFGEIAVHKGIKARDIRAHAVGREIFGADIEAEGLAAEDAVEMQTVLVQAEIAFAADK